MDDEIAFEENGDLYSYEKKKDGYYELVVQEGFRHGAFSSVFHFKKKEDGWELWRLTLGDYWKMDETDLISEAPPINGWKNADSFPIKSLKKVYDQ
jgi:hypothetical protein